MFHIFRWLNIALITVLLTQHSFAIAKLVKCEGHVESTATTQVDKATTLSTHKTHSPHMDISDLISEHEQTEMDCQKCQSGQCSCCKGGFCTAFHLQNFLTTESYWLQNKNANLDSFFELKINPLAGIHSPPYHPPKIS
ncbi:hypothetical protein [Neptunicella marina]|uniref:Uncharacterized protein n=1 Tax=Neptunicella marina TaxID=2125989 RepID=A0A8J6LYR4_9ALTE|nr:hypothetical protein [Neptunicella marina]MBC3766269.1 hypothetical protein [Neptunicella marina]